MRLFHERLPRLSVPRQANALGSCIAVARAVLKGDGPERSHLRGKHCHYRANPERIGVAQRNDGRPNSRNKRLSLYDGVLDKRDAKDVLRSMATMRKQSDYSVIFDLNSLWFYAQAALKLGFTKGFFPTPGGCAIRRWRGPRARSWAKQFWPDLTVAEVHDFKKAG